MHHAKSPATFVKVMLRTMLSSESAHEVSSKIHLTIVYHLHTQHTIFWILM